MNGNRVLLAAHRGDLKKCPENTMSAFKSALAMGVDMIETDIHMTADGEIIIMHDRTALRTAGVDRFITDMTLEEVRQLDAGSWFGPEFAGTQVPTVREFLAWVKDTNLLVNWELKDYPQDVGDAHAFECVDKLVALIAEYGMAERSMVNSFSNRVLEYIYRKHGHRFPIHGQGIGPCSRHESLPEVDDCQMFDWTCMYANEKGKSPVDYPENFEFCLQNGVIPCVCIPDTRENYEKALRYGCKMFTSNNIYEADRLLKELGVRA